MNRARILSAVAAVLLLLLGAEQRALGVGEQNARLRGTLVEPGTGVPMPGAKVSVTSDALIGGPRSVLTDEEGRFDFPLLPHGAYVVKIEYEGLKPIKRKVRLDLGATNTLKIEFKAELAQTDTLTVVEERKRLDTDKISTGKVLTAEQQAKIATPRTYQSIVQQLPGVTGGGNPVMAGGSLRQNHYLVDGLDITDPVSNTFSANFNFDAIAQVDTLLLAVDAQYNSLGGVINLVTKRGSDRFNVDASFYMTHQALAAGGRAGTQLYEGRLLDQTDPRPPNALYQVNLNVSGPIIKQKLWYYLSTEFRYTLRSVVPGPPLNVQHVERQSYGIFPRVKLTWAPAARHRVELSVNSDPAFFFNLQQANTYTAEAEYNQEQGGAFGILNYDWFITDNLIFGIQTGLAFNELRIRPASGDLISSQHFDRGSTIRWNAASGARFQNDQRWRFQFDPTITWLKRGWIGSHTFKAGIQIQYIREFREARTPGNLIYTDDTNQQVDAGVLVRNPTSTDVPFPCVPGAPNPIGGSAATPCYQVTLYDPQLGQVRSGVGAGVFIQDTWKPNDWLTLAPGMRIDYGRVVNSQGQIVQNLLGFGPRIGVNVDLTRDNKTLLKLAYGRANEVATLINAFNADAIAKESTWQYTRPDPATMRPGRFDGFFSSTGGPGGYDLRGRCTDGPDAGKLTIDCGNAKLSLNPPRADFVTVAIERELAANVVAGVTYTYRLVSYIFEDIELNAIYALDGSDYARYGDRRYGTIYGYRPTKDAHRRYNGIDFAISGAPSPNWNLFMAYTLSFLDGTNDDQTSPLRDDPPRDFRLRGYLADDHRHQVKANGSYSFKGFTAGINMAFFTGAPATRLYLNNIDYQGRYAWRGLDPNADPNDVRKWTELRSPDVLDIGLRVQYDMHQLIRQHLSFIIDMFNTFDLSTPVDPTTSASGFENRYNQFSPATTTYGTVTNRQQPFRLQLGARFQY